MPEPSGDTATDPRASDAADASTDRDLDFACSVALDSFSGPLDLLLFLVRRAEVDVVDIPISAIADQFIATVSAWQDLDLELAGEFILMAATLLEIKARLIAPPPEEPTEGDGEEEEAIDLRAGLVAKLLAYRRFKEAALDLSEREQDRALRLTRQLHEEIPEDPEEAEGIDLENADPYLLASTWELVMKRITGLGPRTVVGDPVPLEAVFADLIDTMRARGHERLSTLFAAQPSKVGRVTTLMAVLECTRQRFLEAQQHGQYEDVDLRFRAEDERPVRVIEFAAEPPPPRRQKRPPLVTWQPLPGAEAGADESVETEVDEAPVETDEQRFLRELEEACAVDAVLERTADIETSFARYLAEKRGEPWPPPAPAPVEKPVPPPAAEATPAPAAEKPAAPAKPRGRPFQKKVVAEAPTEAPPATAPAAVATEPAVAAEPPLLLLPAPQTIAPEPTPAPVAEVPAPVETPAPVEIPAPISEVPTPAAVVAEPTPVTAAAPTLEPVAVAPEPVAPAPQPEPEPTPVTTAVLPEVREEPVAIAPEPTPVTVAAPIRVDVVPVTVPEVFEPTPVTIAIPQSFIAEEPPEPELKPEVVEEPELPSAATVVTLEAAPVPTPDAHPPRAPLAEPEPEPVVTPAKARTRATTLDRPFRPRGSARRNHALALSATLVLVAAGCWWAFHAATAHREAPAPTVVDQPPAVRIEPSAPAGIDPGPAPMASAAATALADRLLLARDCDELAAWCGVVFDGAALPQRPTIEPWAGISFGPLPEEPAAVATPVEEPVRALALPPPPAPLPAGMPAWLARLATADDFEQFVTRIHEGVPVPPSELPAPVVDEPPQRAFAYQREPMMSSSAWLVIWAWSGDPTP